MKTLRWVAIVLLGFLGLGAVAGGLMLIMDPQGKLLSMPLSLLRHSPFDTFLIPGIVLLVANGLMALGVFFMAIFRNQRYPLLTAFQGCVLMGWLVAECIMIRAVAWPHYLYGGIALALIAAGVVLHRSTDVASRAAAGRVKV